MAAGQLGGVNAPARSVSTTTRSGTISAGLTTTDSPGDPVTGRCGPPAGPGRAASPVGCTVSRQVSSLTMSRSSASAASHTSCSSSGGATVPVGSSATASTSTRGSPPSARTRRTVSRSANGSGTPPLGAGAGAW